MTGIKKAGLFLTAVFIISILAGCWDGINSGDESKIGNRTTYVDDYIDTPITRVEDGYTILRLHDEFGFRDRHGYNMWTYFTEYHRGWAYVTGPDMHDKSITYRMRPDGSDIQIVLDHPGFSGGLYHDGWYYYADQWVTIDWYPSPPSRLHRMRLDGSGKKTYAHTGSVDRFAISGGWIYYLSDNDLYRININGGFRRKIAAGCSRFIVSAQIH